MGDGSVGGGPRTGRRPAGRSAAVGILRRQKAWRAENYPAIEPGGGDGLERFGHLLPPHRWQLNFFPALYEKITGLQTIDRFPAAANMMNPLVLVLNLLWPFESAELRPLLEEYLAILFGRTVRIISLRPGFFVEESRQPRTESLVGGAVSDGGGLHGSKDARWPASQSLPHLRIRTETPGGVAGEVLVVGTLGGFGNCPGFSRRSGGRRVNPYPERCLDFDRLRREEYRGCLLSEQGWGLLRSAEPLLKRRVAAARRRASFPGITPCPGAAGLWELLRTAACRSLDDDPSRMVAFYDERTFSVSVAGKRALSGPLGRVHPAVPPGFGGMRVIWTSFQGFLRFVEERSVPSARLWVDYMRDRYFGFEGRRRRGSRHAAG
ncbi:hypothetical protein [Salinispira pacifica]